jgi:hypothetical protein
MSVAIRESELPLRATLLRSGHYRLPDGPPGFAELPAFTATGTRDGQSW